MEKQDIIPKLTETLMDALEIICTDIDGNYRDEYELRTGYFMPELYETIPDIRIRKRIRGCIPSLVRKGYLWIEKTPEVSLMGLTESGLEVFRREMIKDV